MPELSRFFGIVVRMFAETGAGHNRPHFHAYHGEHTAVYEIDVIERMARSIGRSSGTRGHPCSKGGSPIR